MGDRLEDLKHFYSLLDTLRHRLGGVRRLGECSGSMQWPARGAYFFMEPGEIRSDSGSGPPYKRRSRFARYRDFQMLPRTTSEEIVFFGGKDYVPLFCTLTADLTARRTIYYNASRPPEARGCALRRYERSTRTNWHYECARHFLQGLRSGTGSTK